MSEKVEFGDNYAAEQLRRSRHPLRKLAKRFYLRNILEDVEGPTIDFGCGAGQLLAQLPVGSVGLEINSHLVSALKKNGLNATYYDAELDDFSFGVLAGGRFETLVVAHVLEHFNKPDEILRKIFRNIAQFGVRKVIAVLPGIKGFSSDATHKTYVDKDYLERVGLLSSEGFCVTSMTYFPFESEWLGRNFDFYELKVIFEHR